MWSALCCCPSREHHSPGVLDNPALLRVSALLLSIANGRLFSDLPRSSFNATLQAGGKGRRAARTKKAPQRHPLIFGGASAGTTPVSHRPPPRSSGIGAADEAPDGEDGNEPGSSTKRGLGPAGGMVGLGGGGAAGGEPAGGKRKRQRKLFADEERPYSSYVDRWKGEPGALPFAGAHARHVSVCASAPGYRSSAFHSSTTCDSFLQDVEDAASVHT